MSSHSAAWCTWAGSPNPRQVPVGHIIHIEHPRRPGGGYATGDPSPSSLQTPKKFYPIAGVGHELSKALRAGAIAPLPRVQARVQDAETRWETAKASKR